MEISTLSDGSDSAKTPDLPTTIPLPNTAVLLRSSHNSLSWVTDDENIDSNLVLEATRHDAKDMQRMGKKQEFRRSWRQTSAVSFVCVLISTWEVLFLANKQALLDGGLAGFFWSYLWTLVGFCLISASLAEMASMAPTSGGMYHWVSEFAPPRYQKFLSYITGWMAVLSWQAGNASGAFIAGTVIQALMTVNYPDYDPKAWQGTLFVFGTVLLIWLVNTFLVEYVPYIQTVMMYFHVFTFLAVIILLWVMAPHNTHAQVFTHFANTGGWRTTGLSIMIGQFTAAYALVGADASAHMAEETRDAGVAVPRAMTWSFLFDGLMGLVLIVTMLYALTDVSAALGDPSGFPFIWILNQPLWYSPGSVTGITIALIILSLASNISFSAASSRQMFAFARDRGLPFSDWIGQVHPKLMIPLNALTLTCTISCILALINIGSNVAFTAIASSMMVPLMFTYLLSISCVLYRRLSSNPLPEARWSLGDLGTIVNVLSLLYSSFVFFWSFWPTTTESGAANFNWGVVIFLGVTALAVTMWFVDGRRNYVAPASIVKKLRTRR